MGFFSTPPKRVTQKELEGDFFHPSVIGAIRGNFGAEKIPDRHYPVFKAIIDNAMNDKDRYHGNDYTGITAQKIESIKTEMKETGHFNDKQIANVEKHLREKL